MRTGRAVNDRLACVSSLTSLVEAWAKTRDLSFAWYMPNGISFTALEYLLYRMI